jgi:rubrerythrin
VFTDMAAEEDGHRRQLIEAYMERFGNHIPLIRREDVKGLISRRPVWQVRPLGVETIRRYASQMENDAAAFYRRAASKTTDVSVRKLLGDLAAVEEQHEETAGAIEAKHLTGDVREREDADAKRRFVLQIVQPGLVGLMDGSVSTLAPVFAAAFATHSTWNTFLVGLASSIGAGISMGFAEALADDGKLSGRGTPLLRGLVCGLMTTAGGIGHTLPFLVPAFWTATGISIVVVFLELAIIAWIQWKYMDTAPISAMAKVMLGGAVVLAVGIAIGSG